MSSVSEDAVAQALCECERLRRDLDVVDPSARQSAENAYARAVADLERELTRWRSAKHTPPPDGEDPVPSGGNGP